MEGSKYAMVPGKEVLSIAFFLSRTVTLLFPLWSGVSYFQFHRTQNCRLPDYPCHRYKCLSGKGGCQNLTTIAYPQAFALGLYQVFPEKIK
jgi:hypothetical protein